MNIFTKIWRIIFPKNEKKVLVSKTLKIQEKYSRRVDAFSKRNHVLLAGRKR